MSAAALDGVSPRSRRQHPTSSVDAGRAARIAESQSIVLAIFYVQGSPLSDHQLVRLAKSAWRVRQSPQRLRSARAELVEAGRIVRVDGEWRKTRSGYRAQVWRLA